MDSRHKKIKNQIKDHYDCDAANNKETRKHKKIMNLDIKPLKLFEYHQKEINTLFGE